MKAEEIFQHIKALSETSPLIHCITNPISISFCANAILALSCRPMMAEHPMEVGDITVSADALLLNLGNITDVRMESMRISAGCANQKNIPCVLDLVGVACSELRRSFANEMLESHSFSIIKGNYSEIYAMVKEEYCSAGVDSDPILDFAFVNNAAAELARKYGCVVMASGKTDIVTDGRSTVHILNGSPRMSGVTGTGCVLGALCACFLAVCDSISAATAACVLLGICGELSQSARGNGSYAVKIIDNISEISEDDIKKNMRIQEHGEVNEEF